MTVDLVTKSDRKGVAAPVPAADPPPPPSPPSPWPIRVVAGLSVAFVVLFSILVLYKHAHLGTHAFDLAIFDQGLWLLSEGETPFVTVRGLHLFGDHTSFLMFPLVPLYWIWADVRILLILTVLAMAAGGPLVYAAARAERLGRWPSAALGVGFLMMPAVQWQTWDTFHPEVLAIPLLIAAYLLALRQRPSWAIGVLIVVLLAKEDAALVVIPLALYLGIRFRQRWLAIGGVSAAIATLVISFGVVLPHFSPTGELIYTGRYSAFGDSLQGIVWGVVASPGEVVTTALAGGRPFYILMLVLPMVAAAVAPEVLLVAIPTLMANLLSAHTYQAELRYHYTAYIISVVAIAGIVGTKRMIRWSRGWSPRRRTGMVGIAVVAAVVGTLTAGPWGIGQRSPWAGHAPRADLVAEAIAVIPAEAAVSAESRIVPHLAHRRTIYVFPNPVSPRNWSAAEVNPPPPDDFDWLVVRGDLLGMNETFLAELAKLTTAGTFVEVVANDEVTVLRRASGE